MGFTFRKRVRLGKGTYLNLSKSGISISQYLNLSKSGISISQKVGTVTLNSRGNISANFGNGISYRTSLKSKSKKRK